MSAFALAARAVLFAGSRRGQVEPPVCRALVERFRRHGFGFFVGCATRRRCGVPRGAGPLSVRPRRGVRRLRVRQARTALPGRGAVRLGGGARGHPAQRSAGAAHPVAGQAQLAGGAVPRAPCRPAVGAGSRHVFRSSLYHLKPTFVVASRPPVAPAFCRVAAADLFATVDGYWVVPHTFRDGLCDDEY